MISKFLHHCLSLCHYVEWGAHLFDELLQIWRAALHLSPNGCAIHVQVGVDFTYWRKEEFRRFIFVKETPSNECSNSYCYKLQYWKSVHLYVDPASLKNRAFASTHSLFCSSSGTILYTLYGSEMSSCERSVTSSKSGLLLRAHRSLVFHVAGSALSPSLNFPLNTAQAWRTSYIIYSYQFMVLFSSACKSVAKMKFWNSNWLQIHVEDTDIHSTMCFYTRNVILFTA